MGDDGELSRGTPRVYVDITLLARNSSLEAYETLKSER
jgi:hypothetical protein